MGNEAAEWKSRAESAEAALKERDEQCVWRSETRADVLWYTGCGQTLWFEEEVPDNEYKFCPYCGHAIAMMNDAPKLAKN